MKKAPPSGWRFRLGRWLPYALVMPDIAPQAVIDKIVGRIDTSGECWTWPGATSSGYGHVAWSLGQRRMVYGRVHRILFTALRGAIPDGYDLDHLCHDPRTCAVKPSSKCPHRRCCNPGHLEPVTRQVNLLRGGTIAADRSRVTHCPKGHEHSDSNTLVSVKGQRQCKECTYERNRAYYWANRERRKAYNAAWRQKAALARAAVQHAT